MQSKTQELNKVVKGTDPKATSDSGGIKPYTNVPGYDSPWDINSLVPVQYYLECTLSPSVVNVKVTPYIAWLIMMVPMMGFTIHQQVGLI